MQAIADSLLDGSFIDLILGLVLLEAVILLFFKFALGKGPSISDWLPNLVSGGALLVSLRLALAESEWSWIAMALLVALAAHLTELVYRFLLKTNSREDGI